MVKLVVPTKIFDYQDVTINVYHAESGQGLPKHDHTFSHLTTCWSGKCIVRKEGKYLIMDKHTDPINLVANEWHEIEALEDNTIFVNIFNKQTV